MERCSLCGGQVVNGRCTECGWNNRKNDSRYHLNEHNRKSVQLHGGSCEEDVYKRQVYDYGLTDRTDIDVYKRQC